MQKFYSRGLLACLSLITLASCQDHDAGFTEADVKKGLYAKNFEKTFGTIDPNQDWSMAQQVTANVSGVEDGIMEIYYSCPIGKDPVILAYGKIEGGQGTLKFDVTKGTKQVYARVKDVNGNYNFKGYFDIKDGELVISNAQTRAKRYNIPDPSGTCLATKSEAITLSSSQLLDHSKDDQMEIKPYAALLPAEQAGYIDGKHYSKSTGQGISADFLHTASFTNVYNVYNVLDFTNRPWWYVGDVAHYFIDIDGERAVFKESENHVELMKDGAVPHLEKDLVFEIAEGGGSFYLDYFFKGTKYDNQFGYFYFTGNIPTYSEFMSMNKYVLINDMSHKDGGTGVQITETESRDWDLLRNQAPGSATSGIDINGLSNDESNWDCKIIGTRIPFVYWGADGNTPSYHFPAGTKIGLFFIGNNNDGRDNLIITSISKLNLDLYDETPHAASFKYDGEVVFAMEDMRWGGDKDVNDAMFIASGDFKREVIPEIRPVTPQGQTWIMACEDLGGTFDYDFNDLVFGIRKTPKSDGEHADLYLVPLASGGTLDAKVYYGTTLLGEMHNMVRSGASTSTPLNVVAGSRPAEGTPVYIGEVAQDASVTSLANNFKIVVTRKDDTTGTGDSDDINIGFAKGDSYTAPQILLLPSGWDWPSESTPITEVYPDFEKWVSNAGVLSWCADSKKSSGSSFVNNPVAKAPVQVEPGTETTPENPGSGSGSGGTEPSTPTDGIWNITLSGATANAETNTAYVEKGKSIELAINVEGVSDLSTLSISCSSYSGTTFITVPAYNNDGKVHITGNAVGSARVAVVIEGDDDHQKTRKEFMIVVTDRMPEFSLNIGGTTVDETHEYSVVRGNEISTFNIVFEKDGSNNNIGDGNAIEVTSSNTDVAAILYNGVEGTGNFSGHNIKAKSVGKTIITVRHKPVSGSWAEKSVSFTLNVTEPQQPVPSFTINPSAKEITLKVGQEYVYTVNLISGDHGKMSVYSEDTNIATVAFNIHWQDGNKITAVAEGETYVVVKHASVAYTNETYPGWAEHVETIKVNVIPADSPDPELPGSPDEGGNDITPSGTTTFSGETLNALINESDINVPSTACQTTTSCTVKLIVTPNDNGAFYMNAWLNDASKSQVFDGIANQYTQYQNNSVNANEELTFTVPNSAFSGLNQYGFGLHILQGTVTKIVVITE